MAEESSLTAAAVLADDRGMVDCNNDLRIVLQLVTAAPLQRHAVTHLWRLLVVDSPSGISDLG